MMFEIPPIPDKLFFRIGEVSELSGSNPMCFATGNRSSPAWRRRNPVRGQRMFRRKDVDLLFNIKHLLYDEKFTIEGARKALQGSAEEGYRRTHSAPGSRCFRGRDPLPEIRKELADILNYYHSYLIVGMIRS